MSDWKNKLNEIFAQFGDQKSYEKIAMPPQYLAVLEALRRVEVELDRRSVWSEFTGSPSGEGAKIEIWTPDKYTITIIVSFMDSGIRIYSLFSLYGAGILPVDIIEIEAPEIPVDDIAGAVVSVYTQTLERREKGDFDPPKHPRNPHIEHIRRKHHPGKPK